jgi:hypothetical protein
MQAVVVEFFIKKKTGAKHLESSHQTDAWRHQQALSRAFPPTEKRFAENRRKRWNFGKRLRGSSKDDIDSYL